MNRSLRYLEYFNNKQDEIVNINSNVKEDSIVNSNWIMLYLIVFVVILYFVIEYVNFD